MKTLPSVITLLLLSFSCTAQQHGYHDYAIVDTSAWAFPGTDSIQHVLNESQGTQVFFMNRKSGDAKSASIAYPKKLNFRDGVIEADLAWHGRQNGFIGLAFRIRDPRHYDVIYFRPESSGTMTAVQYVPEKQAGFNWWDYEGKPYQAKAALPLHDWFHVKLVIKGNVVTVYVGHSTRPAMIYQALDSSLPQGSAGFWLGNSEEGAYKNLTITVLK